MCRGPAPLSFFITCLFISKSSPLHPVPANRASPCCLCGRGGDDCRVKYTRREHGVKLAAGELSSTVMLHFYCLRFRSNYQIFSGPPRGCFLQTLPHSCITCATPEAMQTEKLTLDSIRSAQTRTHMRFDRRMTAREEEEAAGWQPLVKRVRTRRAKGSERARIGLTSTKTTANWPLRANNSSCWICSTQRSTVEVNATRLTDKNETFFLSGSVE